MKVHKIRRREGFDYYGPWGAPLCDPGGVGRAGSVEWKKVTCKRCLAKRKAARRGKNG